MLDRPPLLLRWETHLAVGVLGLLLATLDRTADVAREPDLSATSPELRRWWEAGRRERSTPSWRRRFVQERGVLRGLTSLLLAWRAYSLERAASPR